MDTEENVDVRNGIVLEMDDVWKVETDVWGRTDKQPPDVPVEKNPPQQNERRPDLFEFCFAPFVVNN